MAIIGWESLTEHTMYLSACTFEECVEADMREELETKSITLDSSERASERANRKGQSGTHRSVIELGMSKERKERMTGRAAREQRNSAWRIT